jgi:hypothetical protein
VVSRISWLSGNSSGNNFDSFLDTRFISSISNQDGRLLGFTVNSRFSNNHSSGENWDGTFGYAPFKTFLYSPCISSALNGGLSAIASYKTHPSDQISLFSLYG